VPDLPITGAAGQEGALPTVAGGLRSAAAGQVRRSGGRAARRAARRATLAEGLPWR
jgi:hypothetical protein